MSFISKIFCCKSCRRTEGPSNREEVIAIRLTQSDKTIRTNQVDNTPQPSTSNATPLLTTQSIKFPSFLKEEAKEFGLRMNAHITNNKLNPPDFFHKEMWRIKSGLQGHIAGSENITAMSFIAFQSYCTTHKIILNNDEIKTIFFNESSLGEYFPDGMMNEELIKYLLGNKETGRDIYDFLTENKYKDKRGRDLSASELLFIHSILQKTWKALIMKYNKNTFVDTRNTKEDFINLVLKLKEFGSSYGSYGEFLDEFPSIKSQLRFDISYEELNIAPPPEYSSLFSEKEIDKQ